MTNQDSQTVAVIGAGLGGLIGSTGGIVWILIGILSGGIIGYLSYNPKQVVHAFRLAAQEAWPKISLKKIAPSWNRRALYHWQV